MKRSWVLEAWLAVLLAFASGLAAQDPFDPCAALLAAQGGHEAERCFYKEATQTGQFAAAGARLEALLAQHPEEPWLHIALANISRNRHDPAVELHYRRAIELFEAGDEQDATFTPRLNLAQILERQGRFSEAEALLFQAEPLVASSTDTAPRARMQLAWARHGLRQGKDLARAATRASSAVAEAAAAGPEAEPIEMHSLSLLATISYELGRFSETKQTLEDALALARKNEDLTFEALLSFKLAAHHLATAHPGAKAREDATALLLAARAAAERASNRRLITHTVLELGKLDSGAAGDDHLSSCVELANERDLALALCQAQQATRQVTAQAAQQLMAQALTNAAQTGDPWATAHLWPERLRLAWTHEPFSTAVGESWDVLATIDGLRAQQGDGEGRAEMMSTWTDAYDVFTGYLLDTSGGSPSRADLSQAFAVGERRRARVLLEDLQTALANDEPPPDLATVEASLEENEAMLVYQLAYWQDIYDQFAGGSWLWAITRDGSQVYRLADRAELESAVEMLAALPAPEEVPASLTPLYRDLLEPALADLPATIERLILVPDGLLHGLPFAVLRESEDAPPLAVRYQLSSVPSAALWLRWRQQEAPTSQAAALIFADPTWRDGLQAAGERKRSPGLEARLGPLPYARKEGRVIRRLLGGSELLLGEEATEARLKEHDLSRFAVLHFAAHAVVNQEDPARSALFLAPGTLPAAGSTEDGQVVLDEIAHLALNGQIVVLSACDSAGGRLVRGEGVMGLARSFFRAGARVVVASLKPLADDKAATFFSAFYRHLRVGKSVDAALAGAQRERIADGADASEWASLVVLGEGRLAPFPGGLADAPSAWWSPTWLIGLGLLGLALFGMWALRRSRDHADDAKA